ncbi:hypothetical protein PIB30_061887 [Stylosanthes scabra]|uniref:Uncharacterized protein n=1 Tax=Stylosanthes scabra TaxID=79078 RepID=A0ABU6TKS5_9FABA|nr:hypothetical protein [Stylosanthes scabra]
MESSLKIVESQNRYASTASMIKQLGRGKSVDLRRPAWPNPKLTETLRFLNFFHRLKRLFLTNLISAILHCKVLPLLASSYLASLPLFT